MKKCLSGIKPTGRLTLGNYIGAIRQFVNLQDEYEMYIFIANLHAITEAQDAKELKQNTKDLIALYLACGLDPQKVTLFLQSDVLEHAELGWVMICNSYMGELNRMTQYKDRSAKKESNITAGLFTYPSLMAADILLYDADVVPVGVDQKQHVELCRDLANRFNHAHGETFVVPEPVVAKVGAKIMSLQTPTKKMSKSEENQKGCIYLLDEPAVARKKIMSAVTDSIGIVQYDLENQPGISNLLTIQSTLSGESIEEIVSKFEDKGYGDFKKYVSETVFDFLSELQSKYKTIMQTGVIEQTLKDGAEKARYVARKKVFKVKKKLGLQLFK
ncbi:tryptophanyl-tRNA synthetase [Breznakia sp. PF5-3]|uniref:tryptophan--tRNA ligase n=1 Tax=unclassified Breznakia TaxID=2623764 RepID=UPI00240517A5|nr:MULTISPECIES: tryptophan--tRNA ligase [unclassified Breznakia]MDF9825902.1 tryptophanyl-tRNA synthetase [Breznakia sp. PM6-1]MDF9836697.1 tryptophanyl-tRNA synthetase [Breznakia sp. PF5-3]MDF9838986.1 tryptophanyl-tRNA synthetase [Breznakia sp. PFB2-8]MDF9861000.1 tryptophanyl-tRNA synthetase [Breznakia sp. PH5-24]